MTETRDDANFTQRRELSNGFGNALGTAVELSVTPALFGLLGWFLDSRIGTFPLMTLVLFGFVVVYLTWKQFRRYDDDMRRHESQLFGPAPEVEK